MNCEIKTRSYEKDNTHEHEEKTEITSELATQIKAANLPKMPHPHVKRLKLVKSLQASSCRLRLLVAPAGYGKTVLMADCARTASCKVIWVPLSGRKLTFDEFVHQLADAIWPDSGPWTETSLQTSLCRNQHKLWLMIDNFPCGVEKSFDKAFSQLLASHGDNISWWVTARRRPGLNFPKLILDGNLLEINFDKLAFNSDETNNLLCSAGISALRAKDIFIRSGGWCAEIILHLRIGADVQSLLFEYLQHELLSELNTEEIEKLISLSNIPIFDEGLCYELFGLSLKSDKIITSLIEKESVLVSSDRRHEGFRLIRPIAKLLAPILQDEQIRDLHFKVYQYYIRKGENHLAIEQALLAEQPVKAAALLEVVNINDLIEVQIARKIINYRNRLPVEIVESNTKLAKLYACSCIITLRPEEAKDSLSILDKALPSSSAVEQLDLTTYCRGIQGIAQHLSGESQAAYYSCSQFLENISHENWLIASMSWAVLIQHRLFRVEFNLAEGLICKALMYSQSIRCQEAECFITLYKSQLLEVKGHINDALIILEQQSDNIKHAQYHKSTLYLRLRLLQATLKLRMGRITEAKQEFEQIQSLAFQTSEVFGYQIFLGYASIALVKGDTKLAEEHVQNAERWLHDQAVEATTYRSVIDKTRAEILIERGDVSPARIILENLVVRHGSLHNPDVIQANAKPDFLYETQLLLARAELKSGLIEEAEARIQLVIKMAFTNGLLLIFCDGLFVQAEIAFERSDTIMAKKLYNRAVNECERLHYRLPIDSIKYRNDKMVRLFSGEPSVFLLSPRETQVLRLVEMGHSNQEIADQLYISLFTVKCHVQKLCGKLEVKRRTQAVSRAKYLGIL